MTVAGDVISLKRIPVVFVRLLTAAERRRYIVLAVLAVLNALLDALALLILVPLLSALTGQSVSGSSLGQITLGIGDPKMLAGIAAVLFVGRGVASVILFRRQISLLNAATARVSSDLLARYGEGLLRTDEAVGSGALVRLVGTSVFTAVLGAGTAFFAIVSDLAVLLTVLVVLLAIEPTMTLCAIAYLAIIAGIYLRVVRARARRAGERAQALGTRLNTSLIEFSRGLRDLIVGGEVRDFADRFRGTVASQTEATRTISVIGYGSRYFMEGVLITGVALAVLVTQIRDPNASLLSSLGILLIGAFRVLPSLSGVLSNAAGLVAAAPDIEWVTESTRRFDADARAVTEEADTRITRVRLSGHLEFHDVSYTYAGRDGAAVSGLSFRLEPGTSIGIVGASGAGKTTVLDLVLGLIDPESGSITLDAGLGLRACRREWQSILGYVPQDVFLLNASIAENVRFAFGDRGDDDESVWEALRLAHLDSEVASLAGGIHQVLGESGLGLSGGQRQRLGIARAMYRKPKVLVLDEVTSAMDGATEGNITRLLERMRGRTSSIIVAHRLSTIEHCDQILVMKDGRVIARGPYDELASNVPEFREIIANSAITRSR